jgi:predicted ferric reductase
MFPSFCLLPRTVRLGNHTKRIAKYAEKCVSESRQALIRVDGPYGNLTFNYRRYGSLILVGGGIGITPIISIMKDVYEKGDVNHIKKTSHCMKNMHLIWIMPFEADAALFLDQLLIYRELSIHDPSLPLLEVSIHVTREESMHKNGMEPIFYSKPDFQVVMDDVKVKAEEGGASSILVFACGPGRSVICFFCSNFISESAVLLIMLV